MSAVQTARQIWSAPIVLGIVITVGLVSALLADGVWDVISWVALAVPLIVVLRYSTFRKRS